MRPPQGAYPLLDGLLDQLDGPSRSGGADDLFEFGLETLLDGLAGRRSSERLARVEDAAAGSNTRLDPAAQPTAARPDLALQPRAA